MDANIYHKHKDMIITTLLFWEEISERSIKPKKLAAQEQPKKKKDKYKKGSGAEQPQNRRLRTRRRNQRRC